MAEHFETYLGIGSNLGDRESKIRFALCQLGEILKIEKLSKIYETAPWGYRNQPTFLNLVVKCTTNLSPKDLLNSCKTIEKEAGREVSFKYGPRALDIDILIYENLVIKDASLEIPHGMLHMRAFVLIPLKEIAPYWIHPVLQVSVSEMIEKLETMEEVTYWATK
jgi:2-amino-4-hydroxy-6-hydroxymethyldihydropteridine diphosphokinase